MTQFNLAGVQNFTLPTPGNAVMRTLTFSDSDNGKPFGFQNTISSLPPGFSPQGVIIDTRQVVTSDTVQIVLGGTSQFEITQASGEYASYLVPAYDTPILTIEGLSPGDVIIVYCMNFPVFPQQYGVPNLTINLSSPGPIGNTTPNTGAFTTLTAESIPVPGPIGGTTPNTGAFTELTVTGQSSFPQATASGSPVTFGQANSIYQPAGNYVTTFNGRYGAVTLTSGDVTVALGFTPMSSNSDSTSATTWYCNAGNTYIGALGGSNGINLYPNSYIIASGGNIEYNSPSGTSHSFNNNIIAPNFVLSSDRKFKKNIKPIKHALEVINQLKPKTYTKNNQENSGFIAQDVAKIPELKHLVIKTKEGLHLDYIGMIAWLVKAIQELQ
jgi:hypothetical protein